MDDPRTVWLVVVNLALGAIVFLFCALLLTGVIREFVERVRRRHAYRAELYRDLESHFRRTPKC